jgi:hypothetical protein
MSPSFLLRFFSVVISFLVMAVVPSYAQGTFINFGNEANYYVDRLDIKYGKILPVTHTSDKPYHRGKVAKMAETLMLSNIKFAKVQQSQIQFLMDENGEWLDSLESKTKRPAWKFWREPASFLHYSTKKKGLFDVRLNPMVDVRVGVESYKSRFVFTRSVGVEVRGNIKRVFSFYFNVTGNSARPPAYVADKVRTTASNYPYVPGQAYWKDYSSKIFKFDDGIDYFDARGYINVNTLKYINITFGRDKHFIGNGQRSFFLSDFSAPYLFLKFSVDVWRVRYQSILAELNSPYNRGADALLPKKYMAVHHLSIQAAHFLNIGLFEGVISKRSNHFELQYLNPIIFYRAIEHAVGSPDNVLIGADIKVNLINHLSIYGQVVLDEFNFKYALNKSGWWANKWAMQLGVKYIDIIKNLDGQVEFNMARPFTYTAGTEISYSHYNQPLAHPLGANFYEIILQLRYQPLPNLTMNAKFITAQVGDDTLDLSLGTSAMTNYGGDILRNSGGGTTVSREFGNKLLQGAKGSINYFQFLLTYRPWHNVYLDVDMTYRSKSSVKSVNNPTFINSSFLFSVGVRMNIAPKSYEF